MGIWRQHPPLLRVPQSQATVRSLQTNQNAAIGRARNCSGTEAGAEDSKGTCGMVHDASKAPAI